MSDVTNNTTVFDMYSDQGLLNAYFSGIIPVVQQVVGAGVLVVAATTALIRKITLIFLERKLSKGNLSNDEANNVRARIRYTKIDLDKQQTKIMWSFITMIPVAGSIMNAILLICVAAKMKFKEMHPEKR